MKSAISRASAAMARASRKTLTPDMAPYAGYLFQESDNGRAQGFTAATKAGSHVYARQDGGEWRALHHTMKQVYGPTFSADGALAILQTNERSENLDTALITRDTASGEQLRELWDGEGTSISIASAAFSPIAGDERALAQSNASGYNRPLIWNARTGERQELDVPEIEGELLPVAWSPDAEQILLLQLWQAQHRLYLYDIASGAATRLLITRPACSAAFSATPPSAMAKSGPPGRIRSSPRASSPSMRPAAR